MRKLRMSELKRLSTEEFKKADKHPIAVVLDDVRSSLNVGSVFRTCDAFRIWGLYLAGLTPTPPSREMNKTALGATEAVHWQHFEKASAAVTDLKSRGYIVLSVEQTTGSIPLHTYPFEEQPRVALVFGNEVTGVSKEVLSLCDACIEIPQFGTKHSLNISVSAGIAIWQVTQGQLNSI